MIYTISSGQLFKAFACLVLRLLVFPSGVEAPAGQWQSEERWAQQVVETCESEMSMKTRDAWSTCVLFRSGPERLNFVVRNQNSAFRWITNWPAAGFTPAWQQSIQRSAGRDFFFFFFTNHSCNPSPTQSRLSGFDRKSLQHLCIAEALNCDSSWFSV